MSVSVELVLEVEAAAASEWMAAPAASDHPGGRGGATKRGRGARRSAQPAAHADLGAAIADALSRMPDIDALHPAQVSTVRAFVDPDGAWRVMTSDSGDGVRRTTAVRTSMLVPGVCECEAVWDEPQQAERSESPGSGASSDIRGAFPASLRRALGKSDKHASSPALLVWRGAWRWTGSGGEHVDIELHDVRAVPSEMPARDAAEPAEPTESASASRALARTATAWPTAFCELRLVAQINAAPATADGTKSALEQPSLSASTSASDLPSASASAVSAEHTRLGSTAPPPRERSAADASAQAGPTTAALQALFAAAGVLTDVLPVFPVLMDGYARACKRGPANTPVRAARTDLSRVDRPHGALVELCSSIALQWFGNEAGVRNAAGPEFVHQMRVALRRLKTLLKTFPLWVDDRWTRPIAPDLDWLGTLLGQARDLDVFVDVTLPALAEADVEKASWSSLHAKACARRDDARRQVAAALRSRRYALLSLGWLRWLAMRRVSPGPLAMADKPLADYAVKRVRKHYRRLVAKPDLTSLKPAERHRRRIEAKRLRYTLEFFESLASRKTRRKVSKQLARIQSVLGDGSDAATALRFLEGLDVPPYEHGFARGWCEAINRWSAIEGERLLKALCKPKIVREP